MKKSLTSFVLGTAQNTEAVNKQDTRHKGKRSKLTHSILRKPQAMPETKITEFSITCYTSLARRYSVGQEKSSKELIKIQGKAETYLKTLFWNAGVSGRESPSLQNPHATKRPGPQKSER